MFGLEVFFKALSKWKRKPWLKSEFGGRLNMIYSCVNHWWHSWYSTEFHRVTISGHSESCNIQLKLLLRFWPNSIAMYVQVIQPSVKFFFKVLFQNTFLTGKGDLAVIPNSGTPLTSFLPKIEHLVPTYTPSFPPTPQKMWETPPPPIICHAGTHAPPFLFPYFLLFFLTYFPFPLPSCFNRLIRGSTPTHHFPSKITSCVFPCLCIVSQ